ncbi:MAG: glycosyltransferase family 39 protein [Candidatus Omnitrophica bacterium]|nr:glycosyltransferase family 39 protein [Candidatus Omnitrophota bacterium]
MDKRLGLLWFVATAVRVALIWVQYRYQYFGVDFMAADSHGYVMLAKNILKGAGLTFDGVSPTAGVAPGFPVFLAGLFLIGIQSPVAIALVNSLMGGMTCVLVAALGTRLGGRTVGLASGYIAAFYPHLLFWTPYVLTETPFILAIVWALHLLLRFIEHPSAGRAILCGLVLGCAALVRPIALPFLIFATPWLAWQFRRSGDRLRWVAILAVTASLPLGAWAVRNSLVMGAPIVTSTNAGGDFYMGNSPGATGGSRGYVDRKDFDPYPVPPGLSEVEVNSLFWRESLKFLREHPGAVPRLFVRKQMNMWRPTYERASLRNWLILGGSYILTMCFSVLGIAYAVRTRLSLPVTRLLLIFIGVFVVQHGIVTGMIRFRVPVEPALIVFAGMGLAFAFSLPKETAS